MLPDNNQNQTPYAVVKLEEAARTVKQAINELTSLRKKLDKMKGNKPKAQEIYADLQQQFGRLKNALETSTLALLEMELPDMADYSAKLTHAVKKFNLMTPDYGKLCKTLSDYLAKLPLSDTKEAKTTNAAIIGRLMASVKMGYYPTDLEHTKLIAQSIEFPEGVTANLLDPCCGCGLALQTLAREHDCNIYGVELDLHRAEEALTRLNRVGFGSYFHSRISQEAFHLMLLNPPYLSVMTEGGSNARSEKRFLIDCYSHLMYGGLIIYIIPYYRLTSDVCRVLCDNFEDLTVWKFMDGEFKKYKQVTVMGLRCKRRDGSKTAQELASLALKPDTLRELSELPEGRYRLPKTEGKVNTFKGAQFNVHELAEQLKRSAGFSKLFEKNKLDSTYKRPLLPLNIGQVGLIGGSGLINGLVECDTPHIIKGRIVKENVVSHEENLNSKGELTSTTVIETRSNKMIFNLLTPQGFLSLSDYGNQDTDGEMNAA
jgi:methylase of polypeptide subunit release factors